MQINRIYNQYKDNAKNPTRYPVFFIPQWHMIYSNSIGKLKFTTNRLNDDNPDAMI